MIKLLDLLNELTSKKPIEYKDNPNTWTHVTSNKEVISDIIKNKKWLGVNEKLEDFSYEVNKKLSANKQNTNVPNFYKGTIYPGASGGTYLITFKVVKNYPGDNFESNNWSTVDYPLIPNSNRVNKISFNKSGLIGILKPESRAIKNFKFHKYNNISKKYEEFNI